jgi:hypothetical protein
LLIRVISATGAAEDYVAHEVAEVLGETPLSDTDGTTTGGVA